jgi:hypothetical protein
VRLECGLAIDCCGNELIVRESIIVCLTDHLDERARKRLHDDGGTVWLSICFREQPIEPTRPLSVDECGSLLPECVHARVRDDVCIKVTTEAPEPRSPCSACSDPCCDGCLLLARIRFRAGHPIGAGDIDNSVRRPIAQFETTRVSRIGWTHGARYTRSETRELLRKGLYLQFSRPVHASTLYARGVFDLWAIEGGGGRRGGIYHIDTEPEPAAGELVTSVVFHDRTDEVRQPGDRLLITLRTSFILDECCRPVDGEHVGGLVPIAEDYERWRRDDPPNRAPCTQPPPGQLLPWASGNGIPAGTFESWIYVGPAAGGHEVE